MNQRILLGATFAAVLFIWGCDMQWPPAGAQYSGPDQTLVLNFDGPGPATVVNQNLFELGVPDSHVVTPGTAFAATIYANPTGLVLLNPLLGVASPGANSTAAAYHIMAQVNGVSNAGVTSADVFFTVKPEAANNGFYNGSIFKGIEFYMKVEPVDGASTRTLTAGIAQIKGPEEGGLCTGVGCWANFSVNLTCSTGIWCVYYIPFSNFTRPTWGKAMTPSDLSGENLTKIMSFVWGESGPNVGSYPFDFWVDQIRFYY